MKTWPLPSKKECRKTNVCGTPDISMPSSNSRQPYQINVKITAWPQPHKAILIGRENPGSIMRVINLNEPSIVFENTPIDGFAFLP